MQQISSLKEVTRWLVMASDLVLLNALYVILVILALLGLHFYFSNRQRKRLLAK